MLQGQQEKQRTLGKYYISLLSLTFSPMFPLKCQHPHTFLLLSLDDNNKF